MLKPELAKIAVLIAALGGWPSVSPLAETARAANTAGEFVALSETSAERVMLLVADRAADDGQAEEPGGENQRRENEQPYEDGTEDEPDAGDGGTGPDFVQPPGCTFREGPLELLV